MAESKMMEIALRWEVEQQDRYAKSLHRVIELANSELDALMEGKSKCAAKLSTAFAETADAFNTWTAISALIEVTEDQTE